MYRRSLQKVTKVVRTIAQCETRRMLRSSSVSVQHAKKTASALKPGPGLEYFLANSTPSQVPEDSLLHWSESSPYLTEINLNANNRKVYIEVYGCQMNVSDVEVVWSILKTHGYTKTESPEEAHIALLMTCAIREGAEQKVWTRLHQLKAIKNKRSHSTNQLMLGVLGCMAERLKHSLVEADNFVNVVAGPDSYRDLPALFSQAETYHKAINVQLSLEETYADITPVRINPETKTAFISVMRGCDNMCSFCIVPFTRGRERSRPIDSIVEEVRHLASQGVQEVTLLGQNVNSYRDLSRSDHYTSADNTRVISTAPGFKTVYRPKVGGRRFADLLHEVANVEPDMRVRFTSPHPKDFPDEVLHVIRDHPNICRSFHMPAQSGSNRVLESMRRGYTREAYLDLIEKVRSILPDVAFSSDFICGFCGEQDADFEQTLDLVRRVKYHVAFIFPYSMRQKTKAHRSLVDDVPQIIKNERVSKLVAAYREEATLLNQATVGTYQLVLIERKSKRSDQHWAGRNDANIKVIVPDESISESVESSMSRRIKPGDYVLTKILSANSQVLTGQAVHHTSLASNKNRDNPH